MAVVLTHMAEHDVGSCWILQRLYFRKSTSTGRPVSDCMGKTLASATGTEADGC